MGRPERHDVDYFPFYVKDGRTLFILERKYECKGVGFFTNLFRFLAKTPDHYFQVVSESDKLYLLASVKCDEESAMDMIDLMATTGKIDKDLWEHKRVIASEAFLNSIKEAYRKRTIECISIEEIRLKFNVTTGRNTQVDEFLPEETTQASWITTGRSAQRKVKESKVNIYCPNSDEFRLAELLFSMIKKRNPKHKSPNLSAWARHIDYMVRIDGRSVQDIERVITWCQSDQFWQNNILSTDKLRKQFDQLFMKMNTSSKSSGKSFEERVRDELGIEEEKHDDIP